MRYNYSSNIAILKLFQASVILTSLIIRLIIFYQAIFSSSHSSNQLSTSSSIFLFLFNIIQNHYGQHKQHELTRDNSEASL